MSAGALAVLATPASRAWGRSATARAPGRRRRAPGVRGGRPARAGARGIPPFLAFASLTAQTATSAPPAEEKASGKKTAANVKGTYKNNRGQYLLEHGGNHWYVIDDTKHGQPYFFDANRNVSQWEDPRGANYDTFGANVHSEL